MKKKVKHVNLQPYLDYFSVLRKLVNQGMLQIGADELKQHECYITLPALFAVSNGDDPKLMMASGAVADTIRRLRTYAAWLSAEGMPYLRQPFVVHVVQDAAPHDLLWTIIIRKRKIRKWKDKIEVVPYPAK